MHRSTNLKLALALLVAVAAASTISVLCLRRSESYPLSGVNFAGLRWKYLKAADTTVFVWDATTKSNAPMSMVIMQRGDAASSDKPPLQSPRVELKRVNTASFVLLSECPIQTRWAEIRADKGDILVQDPVWRLAITAGASAVRCEKIGAAYPTPLD